MGNNPAKDNMPRPKGSKNKTPAGVRVNAIVSTEVAQWLKSTGISRTIQGLCGDKMYKAVFERLNDLGFTPAEIDTITDWWPVSEHYDWLMTASRAEIEAATAPAYEKQE